MKRAIRAQDTHAYDLMVAAENESGMKQEVLNESDNKFSAEIYDVICANVKGEALTIVKGCDDYTGLLAWHKLHVKHSPKTMARAIRLVASVTCPPAIKDIKNIETELSRWEEKVKMLHKHFGEHFSDLVKIGIVTSILPMAIQNYVYTTIPDKPVYEDVIGRIRSVVSNKVAMSLGPTPMEVGGLQGWRHEEMAEYENEDGDVGAVGANIQCHRCKG
jgi:hypothetical protein